MQREKLAVILAGGTGSRAGGGIPKQFRNIGGVPMILHSIRAFRREDADTRILIVVHKDWQEYLRGILDNAVFGMPEYKIIAGGSTRIESVMNGLGYYRPLSAEALVAVHDAARPFVTHEMIRRGWEAAARSGAAVPVIPLSDSIRRINDRTTMAVPRSQYCLVQTPQVFSFDMLKECYDALKNENGIPDSFTDDASVVEHSGKVVETYTGDPCNIKVTNPIDFVIAEAISSNECTEWQ